MCRTRCWRQCRITSVGLQVGSFVGLSVGDRVGLLVDISIGSRVGIGIVLGVNVGDGVFHLYNSSSISSVIDNNVSS